MDKDREAGLRLGKSRMQKGGNNGAPENPKPGTPIAEARKQARGEILTRFDAHATGEGQSISIARLRIAAKQMAGVIDDEVTPSREKSVALRKLEEALFWANAGVARNRERDGMPA